MQLSLSIPQIFPVEKRFFFSKPGVYLIHIVEIIPKK
jgi:hypothetical protein